MTVLFERHQIPCNCSYCRGEHGRGMLWLPEDKSRTSWRVIYIRGFKSRFYLRWTLSALNWRGQGGSFGLRDFFHWALWIAFLFWIGMILGGAVHASPMQMVASYYGAESGMRTASGQRFHPNGLTAAHRTLAFGTRLRVCLHGCVTVTVNDRGPFIRGRSLDLSEGAARAIGLTGRGVGRVTVSRE